MRSRLDPPGDQQQRLVVPDSRQEGGPRGKESKWSPRCGLESLAGCHLSPPKGLLTG